MKKLKVLDLFSGGCGGFSLGLHRTGGFETVAFCEWDEKRQENLKDKFPGVPVFGDVSKLSSRKFRTPKGFVDQLHYDAEKPLALNTKIDAIVGGFPCTDVSIAGKKKGFFDEETGEKTRSGYWKEYLRLIQEIRPGTVLVENVGNLYSLGLAEVIKDLSGIGYVGEAHVISAASVGASHLRERVFIVAHAEGEGARVNESGLRGQCNGSDLQAPGHPDKKVPKTLKDGLIPDYNVLRCWKPHASEEAASRWWSETALGQRDVFLKAFTLEPAIRRGLFWISEGLDLDRKRSGEAEKLRKRIQGIDREVERIRRKRVQWIGDSIVPQIPELLGRLVLEHEQQRKTGPGRLHNEPSDRRDAVAVSDMEEAI